MCTPFGSNDFLLFRKRLFVNVVFKDGGIVLNPVDIVEPDPYIIHQETYAYIRIPSWQMPVIVR